MERAATADNEKVDVRGTSSPRVTSITLSTRELLRTERLARRIDARAWDCVKYGVTDSSIDYRSPAG